MKKVIFVLALAATFATTVQAQFKAGIKGGVTTYNMKLGDFLVTNGDAAEDFGLAVEDAKFGYQFGLWARIGRGLHLQPEILFSTNKVAYTINNGNGTFTGEETYANIDVPIMAGIKLGPLRAQAGPVARIFLGSDDKLANVIEDFKSDHDRIKIGYQAGVGLDLWSVQLDLRYEGSLRHFGDAISVAGQDFGLDGKAGRVVATVGLAF
ncbi:MAG: outer membrane beta-barrel protein [Saprospiraceae bacterium]